MQIGPSRDFIDEISEESEMEMDDLQESVEERSFEEEEDKDWDFEEEEETAD